MGQIPDSRRPAGRARTLRRALVVLVALLGLGAAGTGVVVTTVGPEEAADPIGSAARLSPPPTVPELGPVPDDPRTADPLVETAPTTTAAPSTRPATTRLPTTTPPPTTQPSTSPPATAPPSTPLPANPLPSNPRPPTTPPPTGPSTTVPPTTVPPTTSAPPVLDLFLGSHGESAATWALPTATGISQSGLPNYDTDLDDDPGRTITRAGPGGGPAGIENVQMWWLPSDSEVPLVGTPHLQLWVAAADFDLAAVGEITVALSACRGLMDCSPLSRTTVSFAQARFGADFGELTITMPPIDATVSSDRVLLLGLTVPHTSDGDVWVAFDSADYPSRGYLT